jgi:hypothetical protein
MCFFSQEKSIMLRFVTCLVVVLSVVAVANAGTITVNPASGNQTLYSYNAFTDNGGAKFTADAAGTYATSWSGNASEGQIYTWADDFNANCTYHFQAAPGSTFASDVAIKWRAELIDYNDGIPTNSSFAFHWSTDGATWTPFAYSVPNPTSNVDRTETTSLAASGFTGGTDLYLAFGIRHGVGETALLFQSRATDPANFVVTGTVTATPEPSTVALIGTGLFGLLAYAWRKRK